MKIDNVEKEQTVCQIINEYMKYIYSCEFKSKHVREICYRHLYTEGSEKQWSYKVCFNHIHSRDEIRRGFTP